MRQSDRENDDVIQLLKKLPTVEDKRSMDEIYRNIKLGMNKKQKRPIFVPVLTSVAGLLIFLLVFPFIFQTSPIDYLSSQSKVKESADSGGMMNQAAESRKLDKDMNQEDEKITMYTEKAMDVKSTLKTAVYEEETLGNEVYTFGVVTKDAIAIPITLLVQESPNEDWLIQSKKEAESLNATAYGFRDVSPLLDAMKLNVESREAKVTIIPENRPFFETNEQQLEYMIQYLLRPHNIEVVKFVNENDEPVELSHFGVVPDVHIEKNLRKAYFLYSVTQDSQYLVPADLPSDSLADALKDMKTKPNSDYKSVIPNAVSAEVVKEDTSDVTIKFDKRIELDQGDQLKNMQLIEGILLTAKEFGKTEVQFENIEPSHWESFQFDQPITVPIAPNLIKR
ncbi:GerMN domain-containing protein [Bacillus sp. FJAT-49732]|uniref:GerMN domain-containing protein n=1 Tax=Lederbergia citrisecunda TaxID=2833583 RepID=A0A942TNQ9_9BACI|nr:GerMN domain-containing protein [Lederbergia citrisecunda]MBS4199539.1 GerMN domain-containing protein [Lederbergia citrisecunda]